MSNQNLNSLIERGEFDAAARLLDDYPDGPDKVQVYQTIANALVIASRFEDALGMLLQIHDSPEMRKEVLKIYTDCLLRGNYYEAWSIVRRSGTWVDEDFWEEALEGGILEELVQRDLVETAKLAIHGFSSQSCKDRLFCYLSRLLRRDHPVGAERILRFVSDEVLHHSLETEN